MKNSEGKRFLMKMPMPIRIVLGWFAILIVAALGVLVYCNRQTQWALNGAGCLLSFAAQCAAFMAIPVGLFYGVVRRRRAWVEVPYLVVGIVAAGILFHEKCFIGFISVFVATVAPVVLMNLPASLCWFEEAKDKSLSIGCGLLILLAASGFLSSCIFSSIETSERKCYIASASALAMKGRNLQQAINKGDPDLENIIEEWNVLDAGDDTDADMFPMMITANFDVSQIPQSWDGVTDQDRVLQICGFSQKALESSLCRNVDKRAIIVVRKGGSAQVIKAKYLTLKNLMGGCSYKLSKPLRAMSNEELKRLLGTPLKQ